jgi:hypothetical protein
MKVQEKYQHLALNKVINWQSNLYCRVEKFYYCLPNNRLKQIDGIRQDV